MGRSEKRRKGSASFAQTLRSSTHLLMLAFIAVILLQGLFRQTLIHPGLFLAVVLAAGVAAAATERHSASI